MTDQDLPSEMSAAKMAAARKKKSAVDKYSRIDLNLLPKSLRFTSRLPRFGADIDSTAQ